MKGLLITTLILLLSFSFSTAQNKKAEKEAAGLALFEKAKAAIAAKDFVIVPDTYEKATEHLSQIPMTQTFYLMKEISYFFRG
jgi:hypothetical protein